MTNTTTARLLVLNVCWLAGVAWATAMGYTAFVFAGDKSLVSYLIAGLVAVSVVMAFRTGKHLLRAAWLSEGLGFLGTLIGIMIGMSGGYDLSTVEGIINAGNALYSGVGTAFCSTIVGAIGMFWLWSIAQVRGDGEGK